MHLACVNAACVYLAGVYLAGVYAPFPWRSGRQWPEDRELDYTYLYIGMYECMRVHVCMCMYVYMYMHACIDLAMHFEFMQASSNIT